MADTTTADTDETKRQQKSKIIKIHISPARVRRHLDKLNINKLIEEKIKVLKNEMKPYDEIDSLLKYGEKQYVDEEVLDKDGKAIFKDNKVVTKSVPKKKTVTGPDGKKKEEFDYKPLSAEHKATLTKQYKEFENSGRKQEIEEELSALAKERIRFSSEAADVLGIVFDELIKQLLVHAMNRVISEEKRIIQVSHMHGPGVENLSLYPLVSALPSWKNPPSPPKKEKAPEPVVHKKGAKGGKKAAKQTKTTTKTHAKTHAKAKVEVHHEQEEEHEIQQHELPDHDKTTFNFYINDACTALINENPKYNHIEDGNGKVSRIRVSSHIRAYCSTLLIELIARLSPQIQFSIDTMNVRTVGKKIIMKIIQGILFDCQPIKEELVYETKMVTPVWEKDADGKHIGEKPEPKPTLVISKKMSFEGTYFAELCKLIDEKCSHLEKKPAEALAEKPAAKPAAPAIKPAAKPATAPAAPKKAQAPANETVVVRKGRRVVKGN